MEISCDMLYTVIKLKNWKIELRRKSKIFYLTNDYASVPGIFYDINNRGIDNNYALDYPEIVPKYIHNFLKRNSSLNSLVNK